MTPSTASSSRSRGMRVVRVVLPAMLILVWLVGAAIGGPYFGRVSEVSSNDQTAYLPASADATRVQHALSDFRDADTIPAVVLMVSDETFTAEQTQAVGDAVSALAGIDGVAEGSSPPIPSEDGRAFQVFVPIDADAGIGTVVTAISTQLQADLPDAVSVYVTGPAGFTADLVDAFKGIDGLLLGVALLAVLIILIVVYRSFLLPVAVLATSVFALTVALLTVWWLAKSGAVLLSGQIQGILFILVIGAATDYSLLYVSRYREALRVHRDHGTATLAALRGSFEPILASGATVIAGLLCLLLSDLKSNSALGPVASIGIVFAMLSALTLLPAVLFAFGRAAFWPRRPHFEPEVVAAENGLPTRGVWLALGRGIQRRPRLVWMLATAVLLVGAAGLTQLQAHGVAQSELVRGESAARDGQVALGEHFPGGSGSPVFILVTEDALAATATTVRDTPGVNAVGVLSADSPSGSAEITPNGVVAPGPGGLVPVEPTVVDGAVMVQATLDDAADSDSAESTVRALRAELDGTGALVGGVTATAIDTKDAAIHDRTLIIPIVLAVILVILMLLLRSVVAPVLLIATTVLSFATALGVSAVVFNGVFHMPGADPAVPLYGFVFLVALGIDYNIFLATRVREESLLHGTREGVIRGLAVTGGVITSAGLVLAATFAALAIIPILFLLQIAFIVAVGVLIDTFLVRAVLVPALFYDLGRVIWWPSKLSALTDAEGRERVAGRQGTAR